MPTLIRNLRRTLDPDVRPGIKFMKAITVINRDDIATYKNYADSVDYFLFDVQQKSTEGKTNWSVLDAYDGEQPFLISGNIGPNDALTIRQSLAINSFPIEKCLGINLDTRFESSPGIKNIELLTHFLEELRH
jgi:phosphoribosylanthranilate isomerase